MGLAAALFPSQKTGHGIGVVRVTSAAKSVTLSPALPRQGGGGLRGLCMRRKVRLATLLQGSRLLTFLV